MAKSIALAADASRLASLLLGYIPAVRAFVAPRQPGASTAIIDRLSHSRALTAFMLGSRSLTISLLCWLVLALTACKKPYRVGEYVLVDWEENRAFPAFITEKLGVSRYRVHFDGFDCDQDVSLERIKGRVEGAVPPASPGKLPCAHAVPAESGSAPAVTPAPYKPGDHVRVTWRGSIYSATVLSVVTKDRFVVHYEGLETAWDESVTLDRIVARRP